MTFTRVNDTDDLPVDPCRGPTGVVGSWLCGIVDATPTRVYVRVPIFLFVPYRLPKAGAA